jgi:superfamily I DNA/RNA helicase
MIGRLPDLLVPTNPMVRQALQLTYSHLFMDEFQDATQPQYDLVKSIFLGSNAVVTAVGDNKQQIIAEHLSLPTETVVAHQQRRSSPGGAMR